MAKLKLQPAPTFKKSVPISQPGATAEFVEFIFKHRDREALQALTERMREGMDDVVLIKELASGWDLEDPFDDDSLKLLVKNFISSPRSIFEVYVEELTKGREKN
jgi:hypothetical protein